MTAGRNAEKMANKRKDAAEKKAYILLEVDPVAVQQAPKISHHFVHVGGEAKVWEALEGSDSEEARKLVNVRSRLNQGQRSSIPFEAIAIAAGLTTKRAFGVISEAILESSDEVSALILNANMPTMVQKAVDRAQAFDGTADAKMLFQAKRFVPVPKGSTTIVNGDVVKGNKNQVAVLPSPEDTGRRLNDRFNMEITVPVAIPAPESDDDGDYDDAED
jgi:hypothetical protein